MRPLNRHAHGEANPERVRRADRTDTRLLGRHTREANPRVEDERTHNDVCETRNQATQGGATIRRRKAKARAHFPWELLMSGGYKARQAAAGHVRAGASAAGLQFGMRAPQNSSGMRATGAPSAVWDASPFARSGMPPHLDHPQ